MIAFSPRTNISPDRIVGAVLFTNFIACYIAIIIHKLFECRSYSVVLSSLMCVNTLFSLCSAFHGLYRNYYSFKAFKESRCPEDEREKKAFQAKRFMSKASFLGALIGLPDMMITAALSALTTMASLRLITLDVKAVAVCGLNACLLINLIKCLAFRVPRECLKIASCRKEKEYSPQIRRGVLTAHQLIQFKELCAFARVGLALHALILKYLAHYRVIHLALPLSMILNLVSFVISWEMYIYELLAPVSQLPVKSCDILENPASIYFNAVETPISIYFDAAENTESVYFDAAEHTVASHLEGTTANKGQAYTSTSADMPLNVKSQSRDPA